MKATTLTWSSKHSSLDASGKITVNNIEANGGTVAGWDIKNAGIYKTTDNKTVSVRPGTNENGDFLVVQDGSNYPFWVRADGSMHAEKGTVGGWGMDSGSLYSDSSGYRAFMQNIKDKDTWVYSIQVREDDGFYYGRWFVTAEGNMYSNGNVRFDGNAHFGGDTSVAKLDVYKDIDVNGNINGYGNLYLIISGVKVNVGVALKRLFTKVGGIYEGF